MKELMSKEQRLSASPLSVVFLAFSAMTLLPGYPILAGALFVCLGMFYSFQSARENNDILYSVLLPVRKTDVVRAKFRFCWRIEAIACAIMAVLTVLRMTLLKDFGPYVTNVLMPANPVFLGFVLLMFSAFNVVFLGGFFRTAYGIGKPFLGFFLVAVVLIGGGETLHHIPRLRVLAQSGLRPLLIQLAVLAGCGIVSLLLNLAACRKSMSRFEKLDF